MQALGRTPAGVAGPWQHQATGRSTAEHAVGPAVHLLPNVCQAVCRPKLLDAGLAAMAAVP